MTSACFQGDVKSKVQRQNCDVVVIIAECRLTEHLCRIKLIAGVCVCVCVQHRMKAILDSWLKVQAAWLYLEPIFGSQDIRNQIPVEGKMFEEVDSQW